MSHGIRPFTVKPVIIRDMGETDVGVVAAIERMSFSAPWSEDSFLNELRKPLSRSLVAVLEERVIAYVCFSHVVDEGHILTLAVHPAYRTMAVAKALVNNAIGELQQLACRFLYLEVRASNTAARGLYEGMGFTVVGVRKGYYVSPPEDAVIMMLEL